MKIADIIHEAHATACEKGWHERPLRNEAGELDVDRVAAKLALIHSEITEAWECWDADEILMHEREGKPCGLTVELADVVLRVSDLIGAILSVEDVNVLYSQSVADLHAAAMQTRQRVGAHSFVYLHALVSSALEKLRRSAPDWLTPLSDIMTMCFIVDVHSSWLFYIDLDEPYQDRLHQDRLISTILYKMAYNRTRPHRHGGKAL